MNDVATKEVEGPLTGRTLTVSKDGKVAPKADKKKSGEVVNFPKAEAKEAEKAAPAKAKKEAPAKAKKETKKAPAKAKAKTSSRGFPSDSKIKILEKDNPHRKTSGDYKKYQKLTN